MGYLCEPESSIIGDLKSDEKWRLKCGTKWTKEDDDNLCAIRNHNKCNV